MSLLATAFGTKVAITTILLVTVGGGVGVAAASGAIPTTPVSVQTEGPTEASGGSGPKATDPAENDDETATATKSPAETESASAPKGPDATGPAAFGLCNAFSHGGLHNTSVAHSALLAAAGSGSIDAYCAPILAAHSHDDSDASTTDSNVVKPHGKSQSAHGHKASGSVDR
ncbi:MAG TPA: hypothetical protein VFU07_01335 [Candidatus Lumbricidophila sp.]|nr:hypothetical protein [Candidatus Lumbricidophila sp.]